MSYLRSVFIQRMYNDNLKMQERIDRKVVKLYELADKLIKEGYDETKVEIAVDKLVRKVRHLNSRSYINRYG